MAFKDFKIGGFALFISCGVMACVSAPPVHKESHQVGELVLTDSDFSGTWKQTKDCSVHQTMRGVVKIRQNTTTSNLLEVI